MRTRRGAGVPGRPGRAARRREPYRRTPRAFRVVDNGSGHRGDAACPRLQTRYLDPTLVHRPAPASGLNQVGLSCAIVRRKVPTPADCADRAAVARHRPDFETRHDDTAVPCHRRLARAARADRRAALPDRPPPRATAPPPLPATATATSCAASPHTLSRNAAVRASHGISYPGVGGYR